MFKHFIKLEWKSFLRSSSFGSNLALKIIMGIFAAFIILEFLALGIFSYDIMEEYNLKPLETVNKYLIYYVLIDLIIRYFLQKMPVTNIKPLLLLPIKRSTIVHFSLGKTAISFFNVMHAFFFVPFTARLLYEGFGFNAVLWHLGIVALIYSNNYINVFVNNKNSVFYGVLAVLIGLIALQYYNIFDLTAYSTQFFQGMYTTNYLFVVPMILVALVYYFSFNYFKSRLNLDDGLAKRSDVATTENFAWLDQFGTLGTFLKNDIRLLKRNKRSKTTVIMSVVFIFYGLLFFTQSIEAYDNPAMKVFAGIFVSGGFLFVFGQFVPSWDSAYYQLMMSQNIQYREYISAKWWLMVIATVITTILASFYLYFGLHTYLIIVVAAIFNIGVNSHLVMLGGAFVKTPIDLTTSKQAFGDKQAFNVKTMLIAIPKMLLPMGLYALGYYLFSPNVGLIFVAVAGVLGFAFRNYVFDKIERIYKTEKYETIAAYKQKN
ncbi:hypothetical protein IVB69_08355 [Flavobacterium sp. J49]|uniref:DUF5687 family protein n=1 Tax=Flavobacterium sp. J49 TaxID=2718534 RepID=UPI0015944DD6|nr:DUF5687 family protein [Flavobacterium sp. J49]MBF6641490.1 hypothetical protein [Flavobacterium sp. J49]NIC02737.1 hypothetical protein [Flavobacterium sp. J49]